MSSRPKTIAVVGAGFMGTVIATLYAHYGYQVKIVDQVPETLETFCTRALPIAMSLVDKKDAANEMLKSVQTVANLEQAIAGVALVHEVIHENLAAKQELFARLDELCRPDVVLGTNTSSFSLSDVCAHVTRRERVVGIHYISPAHLIKVVEIIRADFTPEALIEWTQDFLASIDRVGVVCTELPGFLVNRLQYALIAEAYKILEEGVSTRDDVDKAIRMSIGPRLALWGPLLTEDIVVNKKTTAAVWDYLHRSLHRDHFARPKELDRLLSQGRVGAMNGKGWYDFGKDYQSVVSLRDLQLKELLDWLSKSDRSSKFEIS